MGCLDSGAIGCRDEDSISNWLKVGAWTVDAQEVGRAARVGDGGMLNGGRGWQVENYGIKTQSGGVKLILIL